MFDLFKPNNVYMHSHVQVFAELPQLKVSKRKLIALVASPDRHLCFFVALGDLLTLSPETFWLSTDPESGQWS